MTKKIRKAVIPVAGYGTRFLPVTKIIPKELLPVGSKPAIQYVVEEAIASGIEEIILVCHPRKIGVADYFREDPALQRFLQRHGKVKEMEALVRLETMAKISVVYQYESRGLGHAVLCTREAVGDEPFVVLLPDMIVHHDTPATQQLMNSCERGQWGLLLEKVSKDQVSSYGIVGVDVLADGKRYQLREAIEKPSVEKAPSDLAILGRYLFTPEIFGLIEKSKPGALGEIQLTDAIDTLAKVKPGCGVLCEGRVFDVGTPEGLVKAADYFKEVS